jgi:hypothetical protein
MFPGTIQAMSHQGYTIAWQDGDAPLTVPLGALTFLDWCQAAVPVEAASVEAAAARAAPTSSGASGAKMTLAPPRAAKPQIVPGACVALRRPLPYRLARVEAAFPGGYALQLVDGSRGNVAAADVVPNPAHHVFAVGDPVLAHWNSGTMFPGTITAISEQGYTVAWHDGDAPQTVPLGCLTFLYWVLEP